jgi:hypothetical protein
LNNLGDAISKRHLGLVVNPTTMGIKFVKVEPVEEDTDSLSPNKSRYQSINLRS